jgi:hypothetical protein
MRIRDFSRGTFGICAAGAMLAGCGGPQAPIGGAGAVPRSQAIAVHADRSGSWMRPEAKGEDLLYVADIVALEVFVFSYPQGKAVGALTGIAGGECADKAGDVFITNSSASAVYEYAHGGTKPIKILSDSGYRPYGCAVDLVTGNLAVLSANFRHRNGIAIYKDASGSPTLYRDRTILSYVSCTYDDAGNLFVDGFGPNEKPNYLREFAELPHGKNGFKNITLNEGIKQIGPLLWDGQHVTMGGHRGGLGDPRQLIRRLEISGIHAKALGSTSLDNVVGGAAYFIEGQTVVTPEISRPAVKLFNYPIGGHAIKVITGFKEPVATLISKAE